VTLGVHSEERRSLSLYNWESSTELCMMCLLGNTDLNYHPAVRSPSAEFELYLNCLQRKTPSEMRADMDIVSKMVGALLAYFASCGMRPETATDSMQKFLEQSTLQKAPIWYRNKILKIYSKMKDVFWWRAFYSTSNTQGFASEDERFVMVLIRKYIEAGIMREEQTKLETRKKYMDLGRIFVGRHLTPTLDLPKDDRECIICTAAFGTADEKGSRELAVRTKCIPVSHIIGDICLERWCSEQVYCADKLRCPYCRQSLVTEEEIGVLRFIHRPTNESEEYAARMTKIPKLLEVMAPFLNDEEEGLRTKEYYVQLQDDNVVIEVFKLFARIGTYFQHNSKAKEIVARLQHERVEDDDDNHDQYDVKIPCGQSATVDIAGKGVDEDLVRYWIGRLGSIGVYVDPSIEISAVIKRANFSLQIPGPIMTEGEISRWAEYCNKFSEVDMVDRLYWTNFLADRAEYEEEEDDDFDDDDEGDD